MKIDTKEMERKARIASLSFFGVLFAFCIWWFFASNYDYSVLAGTYTFHGDGVSSKLVLNSDRTFHQEVTRSGQTMTANGTWSRFGEGGVKFSIQFIRVPGAKTFIERFGKGDGSIEDNEFFGHFEKVLGLYPILKIDGNPPEPTFHKILFR